jgi:hypothetical protein
MILGKIRDSAQTKKAKHIRRHARPFQLFSRFWFLKMPFEDAKFSVGLRECSDLFVVRNGV